MIKYVCAVAVVSMLCLSFANAENEKPDVELVYKTIGDKELKLYIFNPADMKKGQPRQAIVFFHGGGWSGGHPNQFYPQARYLADRGMVAISAQYRLTKKDKVEPRECLKDAKAAVRWIRQNADELNIVPETLAAGGGSAGGHLAAATATTKGFEHEGEDLTVSSRPAALVLFNPVYDNSTKGYGHGRVKEYWEAFSPMHNLSKETPPTIVFLGSKDNLIPVSTAEAFKEKMASFGVLSELHVFEGQKHGFFNRGRCPDEVYDMLIGHMDRFLMSLGYLEKK